MTEFLERRKKGIGGSDASAILGINPWKNKLAVYLEKTNQEIIKTETNFTHFGNVLEQVVADEFQRVTGKRVQKYNKLITHPQHEFMIGNIDRKIVGEKAFLECKTTSAFNAKEWEDAIPEYYQAQVQHYLAILGYEKCYVAVLIGGNQFKYYEVQRDEAFIEQLINAERDFWENNVLKLTPPEIDGHDFTTNFLKEKYSNTFSTTITLETSFNEKLTKLKEIKGAIKTLNEEVTLIENEIRDYMKEDETAENEAWKITYKLQNKASFDTKQLKEELPDIYNKYLKNTAYRVMRIKEY